MISSLGFLGSGNEELSNGIRDVLIALAQAQTPEGLIPSLASDPTDLGSSDTTPLFLIGLAFYRKAIGDAGFLQDAAQKALHWMSAQSPDLSGLVGQLPTSDWRDEQWVLGFGLYLNTLVYLSTVLWGQTGQARQINRLVNLPGLRGKCLGHQTHEGLRVPGKPYYALWAYKVYRNERFDLLGNSLAILCGLASNHLAREMLAWVEGRCEEMRARGDLAVNLPPCLFPFILDSDEDWHARMRLFNQPGDYHNGGIWPFICGFYIAALVHCGEFRLAEEKLMALTGLIQHPKDPVLRFGFNEWYKAQDGLPKGQDWQTWSAAMYIYAVTAVERRRAPFFADLYNDGENVTTSML